MSSASGPTALADDDPVGPHTQGVSHQVGRVDPSLAFDVGRPRFEPQHVFLLELQFGRVLDRDDALIALDEARQRVEQRRFTATGASADDDVEPGLDRSFQQHHHFGREGPEPQQVFERQRIGAEPPDGDRRTVERQRRNDGVNTRAVRKTGVAHRRRFVDAPSDLRHDAVEDLHQVVVVAERNLRALNAPVLFEEDVLGAVDHDIGDAVFLEQRLERTEAERLVEHLFDQLFALGAVEQRVFGVAQVLDDEADLAPQRVPFEIAQSGRGRACRPACRGSAASTRRNRSVLGVDRTSGTGRRELGVDHRIRYSLFRCEFE